MQECKKNACVTHQCCVYLFSLLQKLLGMQDGDKKTALELAKESIEPTHEQVEAILQVAEKRIEAAMVENLD